MPGKFSVVTVILQNGQLLPISYLFPFPMHGERIPLTKVKSIRENLREKGLLKNFLKEHPFNMIQNRLNQKPAPQGKVSRQPLRNYFDVSTQEGWPHSAPWCFGQAWGSPEGARRDAGAGSPAGSRTTGGSGTSYPEEKALPTLNSWSAVTGPGND